MALMTQPKWLLLDEPSTGLAPVIVRNVMAQLRKVNEVVWNRTCARRAERARNIETGQRSADPQIGPHRLPGRRGGVGRKVGSLGVVLMSTGTAEARQLAARGFRDLADWAAGAINVPLAADVRRRAAMVLADDIAAIVAASTERQVARAQAGLAAGSAIQEATIIAPGTRRVDRYAAAAANGMAATWCELDEGFRGAPCHAGAYTLPVLLAEAEHREFAGRAHALCDRRRLRRHRAYRIGLSIQNPDGSSACRVRHDRRCRRGGPCRDASTVPRLRVLCQARPA